MTAWHWIGNGALVVGALACVVGLCVAAVRAPHD